MAARLEPGHKDHEPVFLVDETETITFLRRTKAAAYNPDHPDYLRTFVKVADLQDLIDACDAIGADEPVPQEARDLLKLAKRTKVRWMHVVYDFVTSYLESLGKDDVLRLAGL